MSLDDDKLATIMEMSLEDDKLATIMEGSLEGDNWPHHGGES